MQTLYVNQFAPKSNKMTVFFKKVPKGKSDGFAVILDEEVYVLDAGNTYDHGMLEFLLTLRKNWLKNQQDPSLEEDPAAKLLIHLIISHPHGDHINALPEIVKNPFLRIESVLAPVRSHLSTERDGPLPSLTECENKLNELQEALRRYHHGADGIHRIPFGKRVLLPMKNRDGEIEIFPAPFDWSETRKEKGEGFDFIKSYIPATYGDNWEMAYTNGILNANSLWIKIRFGGQSVLFTGDQRDAPEYVERMIRHYGEKNFQCDVLKYLHHGEKNYSPYLLEITKPKITVFTIAKGGEDPRTAATCREIGKLYKLGEEELILTLDGNSIQTSRD